MVACLLFSSPPQPSAGPLDPLALLKQLNSVSLDPSQVYVIRAAHITRARMNLYLNRGFIAFMAPVKGEVTGPFFQGKAKF